MKIDTFLKVARALSKFSLSNKVATIFHFFTPLFYSLFSLHFITPLFHCQRSCLSHGRDQQLCILFAGLCCLSAGRDKASISDKKCDRPRGEGAERVQPTLAAVCQIEETSSYAFYLLGSAVCQREETRRLLAIKSVTGREAKALSADNPRSASWGPRRRR